MYVFTYLPAMRCVILNTPTSVIRFETHVTDQAHTMHACVYMSIFLAVAAEN